MDFRIINYKEIKKQKKLKQILLRIILILTVTVISMPIFAEEYLDIQLFCKEAKSTTQVIPHLFEPSKYENGTSQFFYEIEVNRQFSAKFSDQQRHLKIEFMNQFNQLIEHNFSCNQISNMKKRCSVTVLDMEWIIMYGSLLKKQVTFVRYDFNPQWLDNPDKSQSYMFVTAGFCEKLQ